MDPVGDIHSHMSWSRLSESSSVLLQSATLAAEPAEQASTSGESNADAYRRFASDPVKKHVTVSALPGLCVSQVDCG